MVLERKREGFVSIYNPYAELYIKGNILYAIYKKDVIIDLKVLKKVIEDRLYISKGKDWPAYVDATKVKNWTMEARTYAFKEESLHGILAFAVYSNNIVGNTLINWVNKFIDPKKPFMLFNDKEKALNWLETNYPCPK